MTLKRVPLQATTSNLTSGALIEANANGDLVSSTNTGYYRQFWQKQGTVVQGAWSWVVDATQTDFSSVTEEGPGAWGNTGNVLNDEYKWSSVFLPAGNYKITFVGIKFPNGGIVEFLHGTASVGTVDMYAVAGTYNVISTITFIVSSPATADLRIRSSTKNGSSGGYGIRTSRCQLEKIG